MIAPKHSSNAVSAGTANRSVPDLIPARMLNEFSYCQRLGYLEFVDGEWDDNFYTKQGTFGHRRVDKEDRKQFAAPSAENATSEKEPSPDADDSPQLHARSILLSAPKEGPLYLGYASQFGLGLFVATSDKSS